jgi:hypothetical protein
MSQEAATAEKAILDESPADLLQVEAAKRIGRIFASMARLQASDKEDLRS